MPNVSEEAVRQVAQQEIRKIKAEALAFEAIWKPSLAVVQKKRLSGLPLSEQEKTFIITAYKAIQRTKERIQQAGRLGQETLEPQRQARRTFIAAANLAAEKIKHEIKERAADWSGEPDLQVLHDAARGLTETIQCLLHDDAFTDRATSMMRCTDILMRAHQAYAVTLSHEEWADSAFGDAVILHPLDAPAGAWAGVLRAEGLPVPGYLESILNAIKTRPNSIAAFQVALRSVVTAIQTGSGKNDASGWSQVAYGIGEASKLIGAPFVADELYSDVNVDGVKDELREAGKMLVEAQQILKRRGNVSGSVAKTREAGLKAMKGVILFLTGVNRRLKADEAEQVALETAEEAVEAVEAAAIEEDVDLSEPTYITSAPSQPTYVVPRSTVEAPAIDPEKDRILMELFRQAIREVVSGSAA